MGFGRSHLASYVMSHRDLVAKRVLANRVAVNGCGGRLLSIGQQGIVERINVVGIHCRALNRKRGGDFSRPVKGSTLTCLEGLAGPADSQAAIAAAPVTCLATSSVVGWWCQTVFGAMAISGSYGVKCRHDEHNQSESHY
jgi:hypothetical protein